MKIKLSDLTKFFVKKTANKITQMFDLKTRLEYVLQHCDDEMEKYILNSKNVLINEQELKTKVVALTNMKSQLNTDMEKLIKENDLTAAKAAYIRYSGCNEALELTKLAYDNVSNQCETVREQIRNMESYKEIISAKIDYFTVKINALKLSAIANDSGNSNFNTECDAMLKEIEDEIKHEEYAINAQMQINEIRNKSNVNNDYEPKPINMEAFNDIVKRIRG